MTKEQSQTQHKLFTVSLGANKKDLTEEIFSHKRCAAGITGDVSKLLFELTV